MSSHKSVLDKVRDAISPSRHSHDRDSEVHHSTNGDDSETRGRHAHPHHPTSSGRGGAGNFVERSLSPRGELSKSEEDLKRQHASRSRSRGVGRGGAGNIVQGIEGENGPDEEEKKAREAYEHQEKERHLGHASGRGGAGNIHVE